VGIIRWFTPADNAVIATIRPTRANLLIIGNLLFSSTAELFVFAWPRRPIA
jgi:hypothetical protein